MPRRIVTPREVADYLHKNPTEAAAGFIAVGLVLKVTVIMKLISYALLTFGLIFLWEAFKQSKEPNNGR